MTGLEWILVGVISAMFFTAAVVMLMGGKPPPQAPDTPLSAPSIEEGRNIPVLFGSRMIKSPSIAWWGDVNIVKVEVPGGGKKG